MSSQKLLLLQNWKIDDDMGSDGVEFEGHEQ